MSLKDKLNQELKTAMKAKDQAALRALRALKSAILLAETAEGRVHGTPLTEAEEMKLLAKQAKQRRDSYEQFVANNRNDLAQKEKEELQVIERFLPKQMSEEELQAEVQKIVAEVGAESMRDMGKVMGVASKKLAGRADGKAISGIVRSLLS
jgi:uncharacterized protein YqeY